MRATKCKTANTSIKRRSRREPRRQLPVPSASAQRSLACRGAPITSNARARVRRRRRMAQRKNKAKIQTQTKHTPARHDYFFLALNAQLTMRGNRRQISLESSAFEADRRAGIANCLKKQTTPRAHSSFDNLMWASLEALRLCVRLCVCACACACVCVKSFFAYFKFQNLYLGRERTRTQFKKDHQP